MSHHITIPPPPKSLHLATWQAPPVPPPLLAAAMLEASDPHEVRHAPHPPPPPPTPVSTPGRQDLSRRTEELDWLRWRQSEGLELALAQRPQPERPLLSRPLAAKRHKVCEPLSPASSTGDYCEY